MGSLFRRLAPVTGLLFVLAGCGTTPATDLAGDPAPATDGGASGTCPEGTEDCVDADLGGNADAGGTAGGAAGGTCLEGTEDCVDADLGGGPIDDDPLNADFDLDAARRDAESLLGASEADLAVWADVRIARKGDEEYVLTMDVVPGRKDVHLDADADGVYRVTTVELQLEDGSTDVFTD